MGGEKTGEHTEPSPRQTDSKSRRWNSSPSPTFLRASGRHQETPELPGSLGAAGRVQGGWQGGHKQGVQEAGNDAPSRQDRSSWSSGIIQTTRTSQELYFENIQRLLNHTI